MGNTPSGEEIDKDTFIEEQRKIIREQNEQIQRLASIAENNTNSSTSLEGQLHEPLQDQQHDHIQRGMYEKKMYEKKMYEKEIREKKKKKKKINPYEILNIGENYDETSLKKAYLSKALETHPDRGGSQEAFQIVTSSYKALMIKLKEQENSHDHNMLRQDSDQFLQQQQSDNYQNRQYRDLSKNFDQNMFNQIYEENKIEDVHEEGYESWMKENNVESESISKDSSLTSDNFNNVFSQHKKEQLKKSGMEIQKYKEPIEDISYKNKSSIMVLGREKVDDFSGESGGLSYRDYKDAYTNTFLTNEEGVNLNRPKNLKSVEKQRSKLSYGMNEEEIEQYALKKLKEEKEEEKRRQRLSRNDQVAFDMYDRVHQRMLGQ